MDDLPNDTRIKLTQLLGVDCMDKTNVEIAELIVEYNYIRAALTERLGINCMDVTDQELALILIEHYYPGWNSVKWPNDVPMSLYDWSRLYKAKVIDVQN